MTAEAGLEICDVSYAYGTKTALKEVTFTVLLFIFPMFFLPSTPCGR